MESFIGILIIVLSFIVSALPLTLAVALLGGKTSILKTILVMLIAGLVTSVIYGLFPYGAIIAFVVLIWIYREMFRLMWIKAILAWLLQLVFVFLFNVILAEFGFNVMNFTIFG